MLNKAAQELGRLSSDKQRETLGEEGYSEEMARRGRLGGRPKKEV